MLLVLISTTLCWRLQTNPFELAAIPHLNGRLFYYGCGMGNLSLAAAIRHIQQRAAAQALSVHGVVADLRDYELDEDLDAVVFIGLLMFFDCPTAFRALSNLQARVREGGVAVVNVLIEGTTYLKMFGAESHCLFSRAEMETHFSGWSVFHFEFSDFEAPGATKKVFTTLIARKTEALQN